MKQQLDGVLGSSQFFRQRWDLRRKREQMAAKNALRAVMAEQVPKGGIGVEVGVYEGEHARIITEVAKPQKLYLVDPWRPIGRPGPMYSGSLRQMERVYRRARRRLRDFPVVFVRDRSPQAASRVPDGLDFVYLDGDHDMEAVFRDICAWWPKIREGGVLWGDNWSVNGWWGADVQDAVKRFIGRHPEYLLEVFNRREPHAQWRIKKVPLFNKVVRRRKEGEGDDP